MSYMKARGNECIFSVNRILHFTNLDRGVVVYITEHFSELKKKYLPQEEDVKTVRDESPPERIGPIIEKKPGLKVNPAPAGTVSKSINPVVDGKKTLPGLEYGIRDLRKAVIWSEILAPPLALRDD